jgi:tetratricopeptide (TPR) repeat protein/Mn-dependent DtxR family transcriptional regulator
VVSACNYPPEEIIKPIFGKPNYEFIILWILNNNEACTWANLKEKIKHSTLSIYLNRLKDREYITKADFNRYQITSKGKDRYYELSEVRQKKRILSFPPDAILRRRNYDHWILWMVYNNNYCKWADFLGDPLSINQSSLSKNLNSLLDKEFVKKEEKEYRITRLGKTEYSNMLRLYDLDRQSILEEENKRIKEITKSTISFFNEHEIKDIDIKFRFLNNKLKLPYEKIKSTLEREEDYDKVLLYLSINHPDRFPQYISPEKFSKKYDINLVKLNFVILRIVEENIFPIKFFKLDVDGDKTFYFQANEKLERMLNVIVEDHVTKFTYLNNLFEETSEETSPLTMESTVDAIIEEIMDSLFKPELNFALRLFLPEYINYLAYKIEKERKLLDTFDKLEGLIWKEIMNVKFSESKEQADEKKELESYLDPAKSFEESLLEIDKAINKTPKKLELYYIKSKIFMYFDQYDEALTLLDRMVLDFPDHEKDLKMKKASILKGMRDIEGGLEIINELITKYPKDNDLLNYQALWYQYLDNKEEALKAIKKLIKREPENGLYIDTYGEILMAFKDYELAIEQFQKAMKLDSNSWYSYQTYIKLGICYRELDEYELALENLTKGRDLIDQSPSDHDTKTMWYSYAEPFIEETQVLMEDF